MSKAIELLKELKHCEEQDIIFNPHHHGFVLDDINQAIAEFEKPEPTSDAVKILCKRYGTSLAKIAIDLEAKNERLKEDITALQQELVEQAKQFHSPQYCKCNWCVMAKDQALKEKRR